MVDHPFRTAAAATAGAYTGVLLEAGVKRTILVLAVDEALGDFSFAVGEIPLAVAWTRTGYVYFYDSTDATTPDDGLTTLVSGNGLRFAIEDAASISLNSVLGIVAAPGGGAVVGDTYIVGVGTGAFAGQDDNLAVLTRRGWVFASPEIGMTVLNEATGQNTQFTDAGWGAFAVAFADGAIPPNAMQFPGGIVVENTLNAPPGSPTTGKFWIVGATPTGAFSGHAADLAYWTGAAWAFMDPADGWGVFHKTFGFEVFYTSGTWLGGAGSNLQEFSTAGATNWTKPATGTMTFVQMWGAGGSGSRSASSQGAGGGGGGGYLELWLPLSLLASTVIVTVGAGGAARTTNNTNGQAGGDSSFGAYGICYGGAGGAFTGASSGGGGGGGGGQKSAGAAASVGTGGAGGGPFGGAAGGTSIFGGGGGGSGSSGAGRAGGESVHGGGGGGSGASGSGVGGAGGASLRGGGGGAGGGNGPGVGGTSTYGGSGGAGADGGVAASAGVQPGGGGGGNEAGNSGKGGDGLVRVTVF